MRSRLAMALLGLMVAIAAPAADDFFDSNGVKIRYVTAGEGEPVVLIHGWMSDSSMWGQDAKGNTKLDALPGFQAIALDCRGHGKSEKLYDPKLYGAEMANDVIRLLDHLKIKKAHLVGYSMGAFIVGKVAATHPERVISTIYGGQAPLLLTSTPYGSSEVDAFVKAVDENKGLGSYYMEVWPPDRPKLTLEQANAIAKIAFAGKDTKAFAAAGRGFAGLQVKADDLKKCKAPALFLYGSKEAESTKKRVDSLLKEDVVAGKLQVIEGADHSSTLTKPAFGMAIVEFLKANKSGPS